jgi:hypothetical protein
LECRFGRSFQSCGRAQARFLHIPARIPDHLHSGPKTVDELAQAIGAKPELLLRLMRATAGLGILAQTPNGKWEQTPMSDVLRSDAAETLRHFACLLADDWHVRALGSLDETVRTGEPALIGFTECRRSRILRRIGNLPKILIER